MLILWGLLGEIGGRWGGEGMGVMISVRTKLLVPLFHFFSGLHFRKDFFPRHAWSTEKIECSERTIINKD